MAYRKDSFAEGEYYHLYNRGNSKQDIFLDDEDRARFVKLLFLCNSEKSINFRDDIVAQGIDAFDFDRDTAIVAIGAWVLMSNHFHLYVTPRRSPEDRPRGKGEVDEVGSRVTHFMKKLLTAYASYFNKKYSRTGALFEGRFKSTHVANDAQAKYLFSYIHLNPVKIIDPTWRQLGVHNLARTKAFLDEYAWSSCLDYSGRSREESKILSKADFPEYFSSPSIFNKEIFEWLANDTE